LAPRTLSFTDIEDILSRKAFPELVDVAENQFIEFKGEPYRLDDDTQKAELAKDLVALANVSGGVIVLGVKTAKFPDFSADVASELRPIPRQRINEEQYKDIARDWIYPPLNELDVVVEDLHASGCIALLRIPQAASEKKPYLIAKQAGDGRKDRRIMFGYAERFGARSIPFTIQQLHQLFSLGQSLGVSTETLRNTLEARLDLIEQGLHSFVEIRNASAHERMAKEFEEIILPTASEVGLSSRPLFVLGSLPTQPIRFPSFFAGANDAFVRAFERPPQFRDSGFDFVLNKQSSLINGSIRRVAVDGYKAFQVDREGALLLLLPGDEDFLSWPQYGRSFQPKAPPLAINTFVLTEVTLLFAYWVKAVYEFAEPAPQRIRFFIGLEGVNTEGGPARLSPYESRPNLFRLSDSDREAPDSRTLKSFEVDAGESADRVAFLLRAEIYHWFGFTDDNIPYTEGSGGQRKTKLPH
jgi:hypothetical protein